MSTNNYYFHTWVFHKMQYYFLEKERNQNTFRKQTIIRIIFKNYFWGIFLRVHTHFSATQNTSTETENIQLALQDYSLVLTFVNVSLCKTGKRKKTGKSNIGGEEKGGRNWDMEVRERKPKPTLTEKGRITVNGKWGLKGTHSSATEKTTVLYSYGCS